MPVPENPLTRLDVAGRHGPGTAGPLRPGERGTVLIVSGPADAEEAMSEAVAWITAFEHDCGLVLDTEATSLYAVKELGGPPWAGSAEGAGPADGAGQDAAAEREERRRQAQTLAPYLDFVLAGGRWYHRAGLSPAAWADRVAQVEGSVAPGSLGTVWDVYPLPTP
ncbi:hypothetical protein [Micrococcus sp.]|uniref:hypothetical protein n=1 Tax=Micrococcus sp. TaxID=1271 RepID=UPI002A910D5D|nr:hypothetical protein [Micrococcus sp.]MDY6055194.1 hypothetical protein [Micrococcus sp.]